MKKMSMTYNSYYVSGLSEIHLKHFKHFFSRGEKGEEKKKEKNEMGKKEVEEKVRSGKENLL